MKFVFEPMTWERVGWNEQFWDPIRQFRAEAAAASSLIGIVREQDTPCVSGQPQIYRHEPAGLT
jgi:hypothetical protein